DWHIVQNEYTSGWTGYTWNRSLFPDPKDLLAWIHQQGIKVILNIHPYDGCHPHEDAYPAFAEWMKQIRCNSEQEEQESKLEVKGHHFIRFDCTDPYFMKGYFKFLHHPHEEIGVDAWWIDWQHGDTCKLK